MKVSFSLVATALMLAAAALQAAPADPVGKPAPPATESKTALKTQVRSLPARGLFQGDRLTDSARRQLADLIVDAIGQQVEVALLVPTGPWKIDESGASQDEATLTPARLAAVKRFLADRGVDPKKIYVESRIDEKLKEPRLDVQIVSRPAAD
jgi:OOP family OmpA-OmpF porin